MSEFTVIDIFCGAGGFSEGFRQKGFKIVAGIDNWKPAIDTFNFNFGTNCETRNVLEFERSIKKIEQLPDTDVIIGSPPCVSFSTSNKSGKADKTLGIKLTKIFLRIIAVKKHKPNSILKAWLMENVANSRIHLPKAYTFEMLGLKNWAVGHGYDPKSIAISLEIHRSVINAADYGTPQARIRVFTGEILGKKKHLIPKSTHQSPDLSGNLPEHITLEYIRRNLPSPNLPKSDKFIVDPLYPCISIKTIDLTDHFYDTGLYTADWKGAKFLKTNHPYMGPMFFPEREDRPIRTVTATKIGSSREAIILKSEDGRLGDGEFRTLTIREAAVFMGFPLDFQFFGSEGAKWRLVGNAVCPPVSRAFAEELRQEYELEGITNFCRGKRKHHSQLAPNLNTFKRKKFDNPPIRNAGSRFRRHPFKDGNLTVTLSNYDIMNNDKCQNRWQTSIQYGTGAGFPMQKIGDGFFIDIEPIIMTFENGAQFIEKINNGFLKRIANASKLQEMYESQQNTGEYLNPVELIDYIGELINSFKISEPIYSDGKQLFFKDLMPKKQLMALYAINKICWVANGGGK